MTQGAIGFFTGATAIAMVFCLHFLVGAAETPFFPTNSRIVATRFPTSERDTVTATLSSAQYAATVVFAPLMAWLVYVLGWHHMFIMMGMIGTVMAIVQRTLVHEPRGHSGVNHAEIGYIETGGDLTDTDCAGMARIEDPKPNYVKQLLQSRTLMGMYIAQYCINVLTYFPIT